MADAFLAARRSFFARLIRFCSAHSTSARACRCRSAAGSTGARKRAERRCLHLLATDSSGCTPGTGAC
eukprot:7391803-Prymnesium_polylepis.1